VKEIRFQLHMPAEIRAIDQSTALTILKATHRYAETGTGHTKALSGAFQGLVRLRVGNYRVLFDESEDSITVHLIRDRRNTYR